MKNRIGSLIKTNFMLLGVVVVASIVLLTNLSGQGPSLDEPSTISVAKSILKFGFPSAWDGKNLLTDARGADFTVINQQYVWTWHPWLQFYIAIVGILVFGDTIVGARVFFAVCGVGTVIVMYLISQEIFRNKIISLLLSIQLTFLLPFFLYMRQARYYSNATFFSLVIFLLLIRLLNNTWGKKETIIYIIASTFLFYSNYLIWMSSLCVVIIAALYKRNKMLTAVTIIEIIFCLTWVWFFRPYNGDPINIYPKHNVFFYPMLQYLSYVQKYVFLLYLFPLIIFITYRSKYVMYMVLIFLWIVVKFFFYSLLLDPHGRYIVDIFPLFILFYGFVYMYLYEMKRIVMLLVLFFVLTGTNILHILPFKLLGSGNVQGEFWPKQFYIELTGTYESLFQQIGPYVQKESKEGDLFWSNGYPWYIYQSSHMPSLSWVCRKDGILLGPESVTKRENVKYFIFFKHDDRLSKDFLTMPCLGKTWQEYLIKNYVKKEFFLTKAAYLVNDPDIINRKYPPESARKDHVIIYQRKENNE